MVDRETTPPATNSPATTSSPVTPARKRLKMSSPGPAAAKELTAETMNIQQPVSNDADAITATVTDDLLTADGEVEPDDDNYSDSSFGSDHSGSTSITSSIYAGYMEHGRRYQTVREGEYWGPSDEKQYESMQACHLVHLVLDSKQKNPLFHSPVPENAQNILDIGAGDGAWAQEVADRFPQASVQGVDLSPPPNTWVPPNCKFEVDDALKPWMYLEKFDLIHLRWMLGAFTPRQWTEVYKQAYEHLAPGGWIEQVEPSIPFHCDDGTLPADSLLAGWGEKMSEVNAATGKPIDTMNTMRSSIEAAGFTNIHEKLYKVPTGNWAKNRILKEAGRLNMVQFKQGMEGYVLYVLTHFGEPEPWSADHVRAYLAGIRRELDVGPHVYQFTRRVWAQKPYSSESKVEKKIEAEDLE